MYLNIKEIIKRVIKYLVEGLAVSVAAALVPQKALKMDEIIIIALVDMEYDVTITGDDLRKCTTINDIYNFVKSKK